MTPVGHQACYGRQLCSLHQSVRVDSVLLVSQQHVQQADSGGGHDRGHAGG